MAKWEPLLDYPNYMASTDGEIKKIELDGSFSDVLMWIDEFGFQVARLERPSGIITEENVSRLIAETFTPTHYGEVNPPPDAWDRIEETNIKHIDGDITNNSFDNLKWVPSTDTSDDILRRQYISEHEQRELKKDQRGRVGKAVVCENMETGERHRFPTQDEAEDFLGVKNISPVLSGRQKSAAGYKIWRDE